MREFCISTNFLKSLDQPFPNLPLHVSFTLFSFQRTGAVSHKAGPLIVALPIAVRPAVLRRGRVARALPLHGSLPTRYAAGSPFCPRRPASTDLQTDVRSQITSERT